MFRFLLPILFAFILAPAIFADDEKGWLGVQIKLEDGKIVVQEIVGNSPAEKAGVKQGDIIQKIGDVVPTELQMFVDEVGKQKPGDKVKLVVTRDGKEVKVSVTMGKRP
jgi:S1-C subfamily serine protease